MFKNAFKYLQPNLNYIESQRIPRLLRIIYLLIAVSTASLAVINFKVVPMGYVIGLYILSASSLLALLSVGKKIELYIRLLIPVLMLVTLHRILLISGGIHDPALVGYPIIIIFTALLHGKRYLPAIVLFSLTSIFLVTYKEMHSTAGTAFAIYTDYLDFGTISIILIASSYFLWEIIKNLEANIKKARTSEQRWRSLVKNAPATVITTDLKGEIDFLNFAPCPEFGEITGSSVLEMFDEAYRTVLQESIDTTVAYQTQSILELPIHCANGETKWYSIRVGINDQSDLDKGLIFIFSEITDRVEAETRLEYQSTHDSLTGFPNRLLFREQLSKALGKSRRNESQLAVIYIDLDKFIEINEMHGHEIGDMTLQIIGSRIQEIMRSSDIVGRHGGDEFFLFIEEIEDNDSITAIVGRLIEAITAPIDFDQRIVKTTCSVGISIFPKDGDDANTLINHAERAMLVAKGKGESSYQFYAEDLGKEVLSEITVKQMLQEALEGGSFRLHFQPLVNMETMKIVGVEALVRLVTPEKELLYPDAFIGVAEKTGQINGIGSWVIKHACEIQAKLQEEYDTEIVMAINLSAIEWQNENLIPMIQEAIQQTGIKPENIEFEITETSMLQNLEQSLLHMRMLRDLGVRLTIDDFGTGYSSLSYLWQLPITGIKIDRSFTHRSEVNTQIRIITRGIIEIAKALGLYVIVEGLETETSLEQFKQMGGNIGQGYYLSRPLEFSSLVEYIQEHEV